MEFKFKSINDIDTINTTEYNSGNYEFVISNEESGTNKLRKHRVDFVELSPRYCHLKDPLYMKENGETRIVIADGDAIAEDIVAGYPIYIEVRNQDIEESSESNESNLTYIPIILPASYTMSHGFGIFDEENLDKYALVLQARSPVSSLNTAYSEITNFDIDTWKFGIIGMGRVADEGIFEFVEKKDSNSGEWLSMTWREMINSTALSQLREINFKIDEVKNRVYFSNDDETIDYVVLKLNGTTISDAVSPDDRISGVWEGQYETIEVPHYEYLGFSGNFSSSNVSNTVTLNKVGSPNWTGEYYFDTETEGEKTWKEYTPGTTITLSGSNDKVYFRGSYSSAPDSSNYLQFSMGGSIAASGSVMSLCGSSNFESMTTVPYKFMFYKLFYDCSTLIKMPELPATTITYYCYCCMFYNCTSLTTVNTLLANRFDDHCCSMMFKNCTSLTTASITLSATTFGLNYCESMFENCTSLTTPPVLPTTSIGASNCYADMFKGCTSLITPPALPATTLMSGCYHAMFSGCTSLTTAPALPATTLAEKCYWSMFDGCTSLITPPALPATTLADDCYCGMFEGCTSLSTSPTLPATILSEHCYDLMFKNCTSLTTAPVLPATTLAKSCYSLMFYGCSSINVQDTINKLISHINLNSSTAPQGLQGIFGGLAITDDMLNSILTNYSLVSTTLIDYCYESMFYDCKLLTKAPILPATTLTSYSYAFMFYGCTSLTTVPKLPATTLADRCYYMMFSGCTSLYVSDTSGTGYDKIWTIPTSGTFANTYSQTNMFYGCLGTRSSSDMAGASGNNYTYYTQNVPVPYNGLCFIANTAGSTVTLNKVGSPSWTGFYSTDGFTWNTYTPGTTGVITLSSAGSKVYFKGTYSSSPWTDSYLQFSMTGSIAASGNIMSFCSGDNYESVTTIPYSFIFYELFNGCASLTTAPELPATKLDSYCYSHMFYNCTSLTTAPKLPATDLAYVCYGGMFYGCTSLMAAPALPATTLADNCYQYMFQNCRSLTTAPELPSTKLAEYCYSYMFAWCTSLTTPPVLPATTLKTWCYCSMFSYCTSLYVSDTSGTGYDKAWTIPSSGTFNDTYAQINMFEHCLGTRSSDDMAGESGSSYTYYIPNSPISGYKGLCLTSNTAGSTITLTKTGSPSWTGYYSTNGTSWTTYTPGTTGAITLTNAGDKVYFKGTYTAANDDSNYLQFTTTGSIAASGNIMSLCSGDNFESAITIPYDYMFYKLFFQCRGLTTCPELPATTLTKHCYHYTFAGCYTLVTTPSVLSATTLAEYCYRAMFDGCKLLTTPPALPATTLAEGCYNNMFCDCTALTTSPVLPATTLAYGCYQFMFANCSSLTTAPELPATTLFTSCYEGMFQGCASLYVSDTSGTGYDKKWAIPSSGTFTNKYECNMLFYNCLGTRESDDMYGEAGTSHIYYTQNEPVSNN